MAVVHWVASVHGTRSGGGVLDVYGLGTATSGGGGGGDGGGGDGGGDGGGEGGGEGEAAESRRPLSASGSPT